MKITILLIFIVNFPLSFRCYATDIELVKLFSQVQTFEDISPFLDDTADRNEIDASSSLVAKPLQVSGQLFNGRVIADNQSVKSITLWTAAERLPPEDARKIFTSLSKKFASSMGESALVENIPNYGDASEVRMDAHLWKRNGDIIVLNITEYANRADVSITRKNQEEWLKSMGADSGEFWNTTLETLDFISITDEKEDNDQKK